MKTRSTTVEVADRSSEKVQVAVRISQPIDKRLELVKVMTGYSKQQIAEDALAAACGKADADAIKRLKQIRDLVAQLPEGKLPFECPLIPEQNNATLTSRGDFANLTPVDGVVAQLVEHHNGIVITLSRRIHSDTNQLTLFGDSKHRFKP